MSQGRLEQQLQKLDLQLQAFALVGIDAWTPGEGDLALGPARVAALVDAHGIPAISSNLSCEGLSLDSHRVVERGGVRLGFVAVIDPALVEEIPGCSAQPPLPALTRVVEQLPQDLDAVILLDHQGVDADETLAAAIPRLDLVVNGHGRKLLTSPRSLGADGVQLAAGSRGKALGVAEIRFTPGADGYAAATSGTDELQRRIERYSDRLAKAEALLADPETDAKTVERATRQKDFYGTELDKMKASLAAAQAASTEPRHQVSGSLVQLTADIEDHPATAALVSGALDAITLAEQQASQEAEHTPEASPFLGSTSCAECHPSEHGQWSTTGHARAWQTLFAEKRHLDRDCFECHVTGAFHDDGPHHPVQVLPALQDVGCESCHGPGRAHVDLARAGQVEQSKGVVVLDPPRETCVQCHDGEQDEGRFDWASYRPRVVHQ